MPLFVDTVKQNIVEQALVNTPVASISVPRASNVPIWVQFVENGAVFDPEATIATITSVATGTNPVFTSPSHGLSAGAVVLAGITGDAKTISSASAASPTVITIAAHGYTGTFDVTIEGNTAIPDGTYVATYIGANTFSIPVNLTTGAGAGGTCTAALPTPDINGARTIASVTTDTFTINALNLTSAGAGGTAT